MLSIIFNAFYIDLFKFYELDYIFWACQEICDQIIKLQVGLINILKIFLNSENEPEKKEIKLTKDNEF